MNAETVALIEESQGWRELALAAEAGRLPQSVGVSLPSVMHGAFAEMYGRLVLGDDGLWVDGAHPDMISAGGANAAPTIEECRRLQGELALHPLSAKRRPAAVWTAAKPAAAASNRLLQIQGAPHVHRRDRSPAQQNRSDPTTNTRSMLGIT